MDAEWGPSQRLSDVFAHPWNMTLGAIQNNNLVRDISKRIAEQNKALGVHFNFSPSVDVNNESEPSNYEKIKAKIAKQEETENKPKMDKEVKEMFELVQQATDAD